MNLPFAFFGGPGGTEMLIILVIAVLLFGKRLPEVARSLGKGLTEFKKGMHGLEDEIERAGSSPSSSSTTSHRSDIDDRDEAVAPKFEPPTAEPQPEKVEG